MRTDNEIGLRVLSRKTTLLLTGFVLALLPSFASAQTKRLVILKFDGVPHDTVDRLVHEQDPRTGKSQLPWIDYIFYQRGTRLENFYVRGISLSGPSWSLLDTGQHLQIKGNVEFDRYTMHVYDYLNLLPLFIKGATGKQVDMPGVQVLDSLGIPLLVDAYSHQESYNGFSVYQRGPRYTTFSNALRNRFKRPPKELFDEWTMGLETRSMIKDELIRELLTKLKDPKVTYLDLVLQDFDHVAHQNGDRETQTQVLKELDNVIGQIWTAIQHTPDAEGTALVVVSDHGINTDPQIYSQGFNLVKLLGSRAGGGHHVTTKRRLLLDYSLKGINPFYDFIVTNSRDSYYLQGQSKDYPTAMLDFDGNERASIHLRDSDLNLLHLILQQLQRKDLDGRFKQPLIEALFETLQHRRDEWKMELDQLNEELAALRRAIQKQEVLAQQQPKQLTEDEKLDGKDEAVKRVFAQLNTWKAQERDYAEFARILFNLLALRREGFDASKVRIEDVIPRQSQGDRNNIYRLQTYVVGIPPSGLVLDSSGRLDMEHSFVRLNYFSLLHDLTVRNNVQSHVSNRPVDLVATTIASERFSSYLKGLDKVESDVIWAYGKDDKQALIFARSDESGGLSFRYQPVKNLRQDIEGRITFDVVEWQNDLPLQIFEDPFLSIPKGPPAEWLSQWHTDLEWMQALHKTRHSNGLIGLFEALANHASPRSSGTLTADDVLMRRFVSRQRELTQPDMVVIADDHWNFDVRGFNPGGNHGSFLRISTHSTWMLAGGTQTKIPHALAIEEPYDSLSFVPTMLALTGKLRDDRSLEPELSKKGFANFPGRVVKEVISNQ
jgi:hypothetical protein